MADEPFSINWRAPDYEYREKTASWYWGSIVIALILLSAAVWQKNYFFALFLIIAEVLVISWANQQPKEFGLAMNEKGLAIGDHQFYPWHDMEAWSVRESGSHLAAITFRFKHKFQPTMRILVPRERLGEIESVLKSLVPQVDDDHSLVDILGDFLGF